MKKETEDQDQRNRCVSRPPMTVDELLRHVPPPLPKWKQGEPMGAKRKTFEQIDQELHETQNNYKSLFAAFELVMQHMDWIGWGDKWERECSQEERIFAEAAQRKHGVIIDGIKGFSK